MGGVKRQQQAEQEAAEAEEAAAAYEDEEQFPPGTSQAGVGQATPLASGTSGTSGTVSSPSFVFSSSADVGNNGDLAGGCGSPLSENNIEYAPPGVPDVPHVPDHGGVETGDVPDAAGQAAILVSGALHVGRMTAVRSSFITHETPNLRDILSTQPVEMDTVIEVARKDTQFATLDGDTHHLETLPSEVELELYLDALDPKPEACWRSHRAGLKAVFVGPYCEARAIAAALKLPTFFRVEIKEETRHPLSRRSDYPNLTCGPVRYNATTPDAPFEFCLNGPLTQQERAQALQKVGMSDGQRYGHCRCPIQPNAESDAADAVHVLGDVVMCHRCAARGISFKGNKPGVFPLRELIGGRTNVLKSMVDNMVHWTHAAIVLEARLPHLGPALRKAAYEMALRAVCEKDDPRLALAFSWSLDIVRGQGAWLDSKSYEITKFENDVASGLPYCLDCKTVIDESGAEKKKAVPNKVRRATAKFRTPEGYTPLRPVRGITFAQDDESIPVLVRPTPKHEVRLLEDPLPLEEAMAQLHLAFPLIDERYLLACLSAAICVEVGGGPPPILCATGPTGSGKTETICIAASFMGDRARKIQLNDGGEQFFRQVGSNAASGYKFQMLDELGKYRNLHERLVGILQLGALIDWRPLYHTHHVSTPLRSAIFIPCVSFPDSVRQSPELIRRTRHIRLHRKVPKWMDTCGGDSFEWRDRSAENASVANSILTHAWRLSHEHDFRFQ